MAAKYGTPYFSNYINSDMNPSDVRSMCCRLRLDLRELRKQNGGNFGAGENTGSIGVVTINLPQIAYTSTTEDEFFKELEAAMNAAARSLDIKRRVVNAYLNKPQSAYPYTKAYLDAGLNNHFSTIGLIGMNEACLNAQWIGKDLTAPESLAWADKVLDFMRNKLSDYQEMYGCLFNLEATPAESTCHTLARIDRRNYPAIITAGGKGAAPYYTNSSHLPVGAVDDVFDALDMEDPMQVKYTSGTVFHAFLGERLPSWQSAAKLVKTIAENYRLPYFTLSPTYSVCEDHGYINGEESTCPVCGKKTEVYSRITGYYRPVSNWNDGKAQEFSDRKTYNAESSAEGHGIAKEQDVQGCSSCTIPENTASEANADSTAAAHDEVVVLSTKTCPKCKIAKTKMDMKGIAYRPVFAEDEDGAELARTLDVTAVPVLIVRKDGEEKILRDFPEIMAWIG